MPAVTCRGGNQRHCAAYLGLVFRFGRCRCQGLRPARKKIAHLGRIFGHPRQDVYKRPLVALQRITDKGDVFHLFLDLRL